MSSSKVEKVFDIMMLGHFARDLNVTDGVEKLESGGAVYYGAVAAAKTGAKVGVISRLNPRDFNYLFELLKYGVEVFPQASAKTSGIKNVYQSSNMDQRTCTLINFAGTYMLNEVLNVPTKIFSIAGIIAPEVNLPLLKALHERYPGKIAADLQGFMRFVEGNNLVFHPWPEQGEGLKLITYLKCDSNESEIATGIKDIREAGRKLKSMGPKDVILTHAKGVTVFTDEGIFEAPWQAKSMKGRTGRGDTTFASYLAKRVTSGSKEAVEWAAALGSLKMETPGPFNRSLDEVKALLQK
ncbi:MAG: PfkB domain-containing protein [Promethearchaeota archaeon CR_4]|nr:MAG: PfkB domain-containing protein [Candidatus Lokiarchaeota archaeon CR_4]